MRVAIIGFGIEGQAAAAYWGAQGHDIVVHDRSIDTAVPAGTTAVLGPDYLNDLSGYDLVVRQQSIHPRLLATEAPVTSVIAEFMARCPAPIIGITGTKGKGTTSTLAATILREAGSTVWLAGNIGRVPLEFLPEITPDDVVVLELSSSQLIDVGRSPQVAVCLMIAPDHLNWHADMAEYTAAKSQLFAHQQPGDLAIYKAGDELSYQIAAVSPGELRPYGEAPGAWVDGENVVIGETQLCPTSEVGLLGPHNLQNICAAITATWELAGRDAAAVRRAVTGFTGLEHRLELAGEVAGVRYYDDSFATTPETAMAAIRSFETHKVVILGGSDKGATFDELAQVVEDERVIHVLLIGERAQVLAEALDRAGFSHYTVVKWQGMAALVQTASHLVEPGDVVLLSPGCASFGLFANYKDRGDQFKAAVQVLAGQLG